MKLNWSENKNSNATSCYTHCTAETPFGRFLITWKGWKENDSPTIDETPWGDGMYGFDDVEDAKEAAELEFNKRLELCTL